MKNKFLIFSTGFALFSMFFGSGNLVFPIVAGTQSEGHYFFAAFGFLLTGALVPFLGVWGMMLYQGDTRSFFGCMGKLGTFWFPLFALALMGPFGVMARCLTVAHGGLQLMFPSLTLPMASAAMCAVIFFLTVNKSRIVPVLGNWLTPFLLFSLAAIAYFGLGHGILPDVEAGRPWDALKNGFFQGYQTMDLLAAFFFSAFVLQHLRKAAAQQGKDVSMAKVFLQSSFIGAGILSAVYVSLVLLGAAYGGDLANVPPQEMFGTIAMKALGPFAAPGVCIALVLACLTTAIVLATLFADFLRKEVAKDQISHRTSMLWTLSIGFFVSTLEFAGIARFLGPILEAVYPALIILTLVNIAHKTWGMKHTHWPVTLAFMAKVCCF